MFKEYRIRYGKSTIIRKLLISLIKKLSALCALCASVVKMLIFNYELREFTRMLFFTSANELLIKKVTRQNHY